MQVVALSGPSAAGKSTLLESISASYSVQNANYRALDRHDLDNRNVLSKWLYIGTWFDRILEAQSQDVTLLVVDRSPIDTAAYAVDGAALLLPAILRSFSEIRLRNIHIISVLITASHDALAARTVARLGVQPHRLAYPELDRAATDRAYRFYQLHPQLWSDTIDTTNLNVEQAVTALRRVLERSA